MKIVPQTDANDQRELDRLRAVVRRLRALGTPSALASAERLERDIEVAVASLEIDSPEPLRRLAFKSRLLLAARCWQ
ncbi:MAG: hypothetical protein SYC29_05035 [Planctomycetota bacterium]|nr:hypothetical protein [Planctomycetota bacterium]